VNARRRIERLEGARRVSHETPAYVDLYFKRLENHRREEAGEPPIPLTPEEERCDPDGEPEFRAYVKRISQQREEQNK
jgi:hypothetical protein